MKRIMHIDIDSFFASAEMNRHKIDETIPLLVTSRVDNGIVCAANYAARTYGIKAAMNLIKAKELCPNIICLKSDLDYYKELSHKFFTFIYFYLKKDVEIFSVDECFVDITNCLEKFNNDERLFVADLKYQIKKQFGLNVTIGISYNKYTAKLLSDNAKPNGFLSNKNVDLMNLKINNLLYINQEKINYLNQHNIIYIADFFNEQNLKLVKGLLRNMFDKIYYSFFTKNDLVKSNLNRPNSLSKAFDFKGVEINPEVIELTLIQLLDELVKSLRKYNFKYEVISIYYRENKKISRISAKIDYTKSWKQNLINLFNNKWKNFEVNYVGITLSNIIEKQDALFDL